MSRDGCLLSPSLHDSTVVLKSPTDSPEPASCPTVLLCKWHHHPTRVQARTILPVPLSLIAQIQLIIKPWKFRPLKVHDGPILLSPANLIPGWASPGIRFQTPLPRLTRSLCCSSRELLLVAPKLPTSLLPLGFPACYLLWPEFFPPRLSIATQSLWILLKRPLSWYAETRLGAPAVFPQYSTPLAITALSFVPGGHIRSLVTRLPEQIAQLDCNARIFILSTPRQQFLFKQHWHSSKTVG